MLNPKEIIDRMCAISGLNRTMLAKQVFDISLNNLSNRIREGRLDFNAILTWALNEDVDLRFLLTGGSQGDKNKSYIMEKAKIHHAPPQKDNENNESQEHDIDDIIHDLLDKTHKILMSETGYAGSLAGNINLFYNSLNYEERISTLENSLAQLIDENSRRFDNISELLDLERKKYNRRQNVLPFDGDEKRSGEGRREGDKGISILEFMPQMQKENG